VNLLHSILISAEGMVIVALLAIIILLFERGGKEYASFMNPLAKLITALAGLGFSGLLNAAVILGLRNYIQYLQKFNFAFFLAFSAFCIGMLSKKPKKLQENQ
jgi:hypothetical protein